MTRHLVIISAILIILTILGIIVGVTSVAPGAMFVSVLCTLPLFLLIFGAALGRASSEFEIVNKQHQQPIPSNRIVRNRPSQQELMS